MGRFLPANSPLLRGVFVLIVLFVSVYGLYHLLKSSISLENKDQIIIVDKTGEGGETHSFKKITSKPNFFKSAVNDVDLYFNEQEFCVVDSSGTQTIFSMRAIKELKRTDVRINNSNVWRIVIKEDGKEITFKFTHNVRFWNKNFVEFHEFLSSLNPEVVKTKWNYLRM
ncbi:MAG: hypothetical protein LBI73_05450 [Myroides sp.]|nr:hypothetical protein [Myroides sp.]